MDFYRTPIATPLLMAVIAVALAAFGGWLVGVVVLFDTSGYATTFVVSAAVLLAAAVLAFLTARTEPGSPKPRKAPERKLPISLV